MGRRAVRRSRRKARSTPVPPEVPRRPLHARLSAKAAAAAVFALAVSIALLAWDRWDRWAARPDALGSDLPPVADYVDPSTCQSCHDEIWQTYRKTGMARSFYRMRSGSEASAFDASSAFYHEASDRHYAMVERAGRYYQRRFQRDARGRYLNVLEKEIHFVMGSGNHARTYLHRSPSGKLVQLPLGWYSEDSGIWRMSPGYDRPNHDGFQRVVSFDCMFCHNGYPEVQEGQDRPGTRPLFQGSIPEGIDCQRCHGPGSVHVDVATMGVAGIDRIASTIVNPARLSAERQLEACFQCHLEPTSRPLPNIIHRYGRGYFSYRPGQPLADYALYFDHAPGTGWDDKFEINHSAYRLMQSPCFVESSPAITCTTCHDPHQPSSTAQAARRYDAACLECHSSQLAAPDSDVGHPWASGCADCHMPKRRTDDVIHAVMTDHRIQAAPAPGLLEPTRERSTLAETAFRGEVVPYYPRTLAGPKEELYRALAQTAQGSNLAAGISRLRSEIGQHDPFEAGFYFELGSALDERGDLKEAATWFERATGKEPAFVLAWIRLGSVLSRAGEHSRSEAALQRAAALDSGDPRIPKERGMNFARQGLFDKAAEACRSGIALDPDLPELHNNLGGALAELGRLQEAESAIREAIRLQPDLAEARFNLGAILVGRGEIDAAVVQWREAIRGDPEYAAARYNLAVILAQRGHLAAAISHLDAALRAEPGFARAQALRDQLAGPVSQ